MKSKKKRVRSQGPHLSHAVAAKSCLGAKTGALDRVVLSFDWFLAKQRYKTKVGIKIYWKLPLGYSSSLGAFALEHRLAIAVLKIVWFHLIEVEIVDWSVGRENSEALFKLGKWPPTAAILGVVHVDSSPEPVVGGAGIRETHLRVFVFL